MPLKYDPDTGIPSYIPDLGEELTEGVTPKPTVISTKSDVFKGDKKPTAEEYEKLRDGEPVKPVTSEEVYRMIEEVAQRVQLSPEEFDKLKADTADFTRSARPGKLDNAIATDAEVDAVEAAAKAQDIVNWPMLRRLIARLRKAEAMTPLWYILGHGYEVTIFKNRLVAEQALKDRNTEGDDRYYQLFEGKYGEEFSGWIGDARRDELG